MKLNKTGKVFAGLTFFSILAIFVICILGISLAWNILGFVLYIIAFFQLSE